jgi:hypothetical protein
VIGTTYLTLEKLGIVLYLFIISSVIGTTYLTLEKLGIYNIYTYC